MLKTKEEHLEEAQKKEQLIQAGKSLKSIELDKKDYKVED